MLQFEISKNFSDSFSITNRNEEACAKLQNAMLNGARLVVKGYTNKEGYPYFWTEVITSNRTDRFSIPAYTEIAQAIINYLLQGKVSEIKFDEAKYETSKTEGDFALELFKLMVEKGIRLNTIGAFKGAKFFNAHTNHLKGQIAFRFARTEELDGYLMENNLI